MLPKSNRLPSSDIRVLMRSGKRISNNFLQFIYRVNSLSASRFAMIISTSIDKRATKRNRIKRLLREAIYRALPQIQGHVDGIFVVVSRRVLTKESDIFQSLMELFHRAGLV